MRRWKGIVSALMVAAALVGCSSPRTSGTAAGPGPTTVADFNEQFRKAFESEDSDAVLRFWCWDGCTREDRADVGKEVEKNFPYAVRGVSIRALAMNEILEYEHNGVTYRPNLLPLGKVVVNFEPNADGITSTSYLMGRKNGILYVASAVPADR